MKVIYEPPPVHHCNPGWIKQKDSVGNGHHFMMGRYKPGTILECECGKKYRAVDAASNYATRGQCTVGAVDWIEIKEKKKRWWRK